MTKPADISPPLEHFLSRLDGVRRSGKGFVAGCPAHDDRHASLSISEGDDGRVLVHCHAGCTFDEIVVAAGLEMRDTFPQRNGNGLRGAPLRVADLAQSKRLPAKFLKSLGLIEDGRVIKIPYYLADGTPAARPRRRSSTSAKTGSSWYGEKADGAIQPYGLWRFAEARAAGFVVLVEGESDAWTLWHHGFPALGIPGADMTGTLQAQHLDAIPLVYLVKEPDKGGTTFVRGMRRRLRVLGFQGQARVVAMQPEAKDPNDLHKKLVDRRGAFTEQFQALLDRAEPLDYQAERDDPDSPALTDMGNAERFAADHGADLRYVWPWKAWLVYDSARWRRDDSGEIMRRAKATVRRMKDQASDGTDEDEKKQLLKHAHASERVVRLEAMIKLARSEPGLPVLPADLDAGAFLFNAANGTLDLRTGILHRHDRQQLLTKASPVAYDSAARCPSLYAFLDRIMGDDEDLIDYLQRLVGYSLTGDISEQIVAILWGGGANGKSTLLETVRFVLGDYGMHTPTSTLMVRRADGPSNDLARLRGARFVTAVETSDGRRLDEALIKQVTGGEPVSARYLHQEFFEYHPQFKLFLATNHKPEIHGTDDGIWRRIHLIPFTVTIPKQEQDRHLLGKLKAEAAGILVWALEGCQAWQAEGLKPPKAVLHATEAYRTEMDVLAAFLADCCDTDWTGSIIPETKSSRLYAAYRSWAERGGEKVESATKFGARLVDRGFRRVRKKDGKHYQGITLKTE